MQVTVRFFLLKERFEEGNVCWTSHPHTQGHREQISQFAILYLYYVNFGKSKVLGFRSKVLTSFCILMP